MTYLFDISKIKPFAATLGGEELQPRHRGQKLIKIKELYCLKNNSLKNEFVALITVGFELEDS